MHVEIHRNLDAEMKQGEREVVLRATGISKSFPGVKALSKVNFAVCKGEVVALLGENGAGKSTLIKILSGVYQSDEGSIEMYGREVHFNIPSQARTAGIGIIHQELNYVGPISIAENIYMNEIPRKGIFVDYRRMYAGAREILKTVGLEIDPRRLMSSCTVAQKQLIEIAKVFSQNVSVLIMDEPTSALNDVETQHLFSLVQRAAKSGISVIYISHRLDEIFELADRVVVLRDGCVVGQVPICEVDKNALIGMMVGRDVSEMYKRRRFAAGDVILEVDGLCSETLRDVSFKARRGQVLGIYGLMGSGHEDIGPLIFGQGEIHSGSIRINGAPVSIRDPHQALLHGIGYVPAERKSEGVILNASVLENAVIPYYQKEARFWDDRRKNHQIARRWIDYLHIRTPGEGTQVDKLSGGNQQKVVLSKWLEIERDILILCEPTRGIDVGAKCEIFEILEDLCRMGKCVIMITSEMVELLSMSDQIIVMHDGRITGAIDAAEATQELVLKYAIGG